MWDIVKTKRSHTSLLFILFLGAFPTISPQHVRGYINTVPTDVEFCLGFGVSPMDEPTGARVGPSVHWDQRPGRQAWGEGTQGEVWTGKQLFLQTLKTWGT